MLILIYIINILRNTTGFGKIEKSEGKRLLENKRIIIWIAALAKRILTVFSKTIAVLRFFILLVKFT